MKVLYLVLLTVSALLLLADAFAGQSTTTATTRRFGVRLLPLGLFFWVLVPWIQIARAL